MTQRLWGDYYFDPEAKTWSGKSTSASGKPLSRAFCKFVLEPIKTLFKACMDQDMALLDKMLTALNIVLTTEEKSLQQKRLLKAVMQKWLPADKALMEMMIVHLPSPAKAQRYRVENLYQGPQDDPSATSIRNCDPNGPLVMYVSKMVPTPDKGRFYAFGRVFSGTLVSKFLQYILSFLIPLKVDKK
jgi:elongation factor 2